jgi:hypothetical protein
VLGGRYLGLDYAMLNSPEDLGPASRAAIAQDSMSRQRIGEVIFEITVMGDYVKVSAVDAATGVEVCVMGPARGPIQVVKTVALRKLQRALGRES